MIGNYAVIAEGVRRDIPVGGLATRRLVFDWAQRVANDYEVRVTVVDSRGHITFYEPR